MIADLDGDGKPDLIVANDYGNTISLYRNISTNGSLTAGSFAPRVDLVTPPGSYSPFGLAVADVDGDGKLDIIVSDYDEYHCFGLPEHLHARQHQFQLVRHASGFCDRCATPRRCGEQTWMATASPICWWLIVVMEPFPFCVTRV